MGFRRFITTMSCLTVAGVAASRPDDITRLISSTFTYIEPLSAQTAASTSSDTNAPATGALAPSAGIPAPGPARSPAVAPSITPPSPSKKSELPVYVPGGHQLTFDGAEELNDTTASPDETAKAAPGKPSKKKRTAVITIEADPRLTGAVTTGGPPVKPVIPAKQLFGAAKVPAKMTPKVYGYYSHGCLAGGVALPIDGPAWQAMRLSRNRNWGHPRLVKLVERLALESQKQDSWPGLLVGDLAQPRGGPMLTGHSSHQVGLDADIWLTPMPNKRLSRKQREELNATSMLDDTGVAVDPKVFGEGQVKLIKRAATYPEVERIFVHPAIKKALCEAAGIDRGWLTKVRPIYGHFYHFHIRISCPPGSGATCKSQAPPLNNDGCGKEVENWLSRVIPRKGPPPPPSKTPPKPKPQLTLAALPAACIGVLEKGPNGIDIPEAARADLKAIAKSPAALRPHLRNQNSAKK